MDWSESDSEASEAAESGDGEAGDDLLFDDDGEAEAGLLFGDDAAAGEPPEEAGQAGQGDSLFGAGTWHDDLPWHVQVGAGFGPAFHGSERPVPQGSTSVPTAAALGMHLFASAEGREQAGLAAGARLQYRTTIGYELTRSADVAVPQMTPARKQHVAVEGLLRWNFSDGEDGFSLPLFVGVSVTDFSTEHPFAALEYGWLAVQARPCLRVVLLDGSLRITAGPTIGVTAYGADGLGQVGISAQGGLLYGAEATVLARVVGHVFVQASFQEQQTQLSASVGTGSLQDVQRVLTLGAAVAY